MSDKPLREEDATDHRSLRAIRLAIYREALTHLLPDRDRAETKEKAYSILRLQEWDLPATPEETRYLGFLALERERKAKRGAANRHPAPPALTPGHTPRD